MKRFSATLLTVALLAVMLCACGNSEKKDTSKASAPATVAATEFVITACTADEAADFQKNLVGSWSSYNKDGVAYTYIFDDKGGVSYQKDGEDAVAYTYAFEKDYLTIKSDKKSFVYQCSRDAVGMMAKLKDGEWQNAYADVETRVEGFNGCVYIDGDILYLGSVCLCRTDKLNSENMSVEGEWIGAVGDVIAFNADGSYHYTDHATEYDGSYTVDLKKNELALTLAGKTTNYTKGMWGLAGIVFHIGNQYYFKSK